MSIYIEKFIDNNILDWEEKLESPPYCIHITRKGHYIMLHYDQRDSDFTNEVVKDCRSIILREYHRAWVWWEVVAFPFRKFGNYGEDYADEIDWTTARVEEKIDGSMIFLWYAEEKWHISTSGCIDAKDAPLPNGIVGVQNFEDLFWLAVKGFTTKDEFLSRLNIYRTYVFELTSPYNRVVVPYKDVELWHIGTRERLGAMEEVDEDIGVQKPKTFQLSSLTECVDAAKKLDYDSEGFVVVDANWHRIKIKSPAWVAVHHLIGNGAMSLRRLLGIIDDHQEFLTYFPEYENIIECIRVMIASICEEIDGDWAKISKYSSSRKEFADAAKKTKYSDALFKRLDGKVENGQGYWNQLPATTKVRILENCGVEV